MRHYEIVFLVHPDQTDQTQSILNKFTSIVTESGGSVHRSENIGSRKLAYPIQDQFKATYALMNIECNKEAIDDIKSSFKFNDSIIRDLILLQKKAYADSSALLKQTKDEEDSVDYLSETKRKTKKEKEVESSVKNTDEDKSEDLPSKDEKLDSEEKSN